MYNYNITAQAISDYNADMMELSAPYIPTDEEMEEMYADAKARGLAE
jgi:hypothetical protein